MSTFAVKVVSLTILPHPDPATTALELAQVAGYQAVVRKGAFATGDLAAYIPEQALVPAELQRELGVEGKLAGSSADRVKAVKLRGVLSQGLVLPARPHWKLGDDVTSELGIRKWEPPIPTALAGQARVLPNPVTVHYDVENAKNYVGDDDPFVLGERVVITEKIHGTFVQYGLTARRADNTRDFFVTSKGLGARGVVLDVSEANAQNLYVRAAQHFSMEERMRAVFGDNDAPVIVCGELFGRGVQDLHYGYDVSTNDTIGFRVFDIFVGTRDYGRYLSDEYDLAAIIGPLSHGLYSTAPKMELDDAIAALGLRRVPVLYRGPYSPEVVAEHTSGQETVSGKALHIREGVVTKPVMERTHKNLGRVLLKSVSSAYLTRKDGTEYT